MYIFFIQNKNGSFKGILGFVSSYLWP